MLEIIIVLVCAVNIIVILTLLKRMESPLRTRQLVLIITAIITVGILVFTVMVVFSDRYDCSAKMWGSSVFAALCAFWFRELIGGQG